jgi:hypothetical protein
MEVIVGLLTISRVYRDQTAILRVQPMDTSLEKFTNRSMQVTIAT